MKTSRSRAHFAEALRWSVEAPFGWWQAAAGLGMAGPAAFGLAIGRPEAGFAAAVGGLMVGALPPERTALGKLEDLALVLAANAAMRGWLGERRRPPPRGAEPGPGRLAS